MPERQRALTAWLRETLCNTADEKKPHCDFQIEPASADASFRRYFRVTGPAVANFSAGLKESLIVMDAPPDKEDSHPFVAISSLLAEAGLNVPVVHAKNFEQGFLLLSDLGNQVYLDSLSEGTVEALYADALNALFNMQHIASQHTAVLPRYDEKLLLSEMALFREWYCQQYRAFSFSHTQQLALDHIFQQLSDSAQAQPQVFVHRDFHSRNIMLSTRDDGEGEPGILDFQDAVFGPVTYDLVSLLRDCYIDWPRERVEQWALDYCHRLADDGLVSRENDSTFLRWFDWMGVQRHLKAAGIFARLHIRDNKPGYLDDIPRTLHYVKDVSARYQELQGLHDLLIELE